MFPAVLHDGELAFVFVVLLVYAGRIPYVSGCVCVCVCTFLLIWFCQDVNALSISLALYIQHFVLICFSSRAPAISLGRCTSSTCIHKHLHVH